MNAVRPAMRSLASAEDAGRVFEAVKPKLAVVYHYKSEEGIAQSVKTEYRGRFVIAHDLMVIDIGNKMACHTRPARPSDDKIPGP